MAGFQQALNPKATQSAGVIEYAIYISAVGWEW